MTRLAERPRPARVALFVTCLGDVFYPEVGEATVRLLHRLGIAVDFPGQTCCGQPAFNAGFGSRQNVARRNLSLFADAEYITSPLAVCGYVARLLSELLRMTGAEAHRPKLGTYLRDSPHSCAVGGSRTSGAVFHGKVTYHASCHLLREPRDSGGTPV